VIKTLTETLLIVILVIFLFLGSVRAVIIPVIAIPISLIGAVFLMKVAGFTINLLTLLAIVLSVGLVVDDAIVMVENIERHLRHATSPFQAALEAARELIGPIIAMSVTLAAGLHAGRDPGRPHRCAVPGVRVHARRRRSSCPGSWRSRCRPCWAPSCSTRATTSTASPAGSTAASTASARVTSASCGRR
jgi:hypothetical protein